MRILFLLFFLLLADAKLQRIDHHVIGGKKLAVYRRFDSKQMIIHHELYRDTRSNGVFIHFMNKHEVIRKIISAFYKPIAKCGIRSYTKPASGTMNRLINELFLDNSNNMAVVSMMVYMYVTSTYRQLDLGSILLQYIIHEGKTLKANYLLLVHDDNGSNKLIKYYERKGFKEIFAFLDKGMLMRL